MHPLDTPKSLRYGSRFEIQKWDAGKYEYMKSGPVSSAQSAYKSGGAWLSSSPHLRSSCIFNPSVCNIVITYVPPSCEWHDLRMKIIEKSIIQSYNPCTILSMFSLCPCISIMCALLVCVVCKHDYVKVKAFTVYKFSQKSWNIQ